MYLNLRQRPQLKEHARFIAKNKSFDFAAPTGDADRFREELQLVLANTSS